jgi:hypothetical protein
VIILLEWRFDIQGQGVGKIQTRVLEWVSKFLYVYILNFHVETRKLEKRDNSVHPFFLQAKIGYIKKTIKTSFSRFPRILPSSKINWENLFTFEFRQCAKPKLSWASPIQDIARNPSLPQGMCFGFFPFFLLVKFFIFF